MFSPSWSLTVALTILFSSLGTLKSIEEVSSNVRVASSIFCSSSASPSCLAVVSAVRRSLRAWSSFVERVISDVSLSEIEFSATCALEAS